MDPVKLLKGLLGNKSLTSGLGGKLLGGLLGGGQTAQAAPGPAGGGLGGMLGGLLGGGKSGGGAGNILGSIFGGGGNQATETAQATQISDAEQATLMIRAMVNAAKSDGRVDQNEQEAIIAKLGDISQAEADFLRKEFAAKLDPVGFAKSIPNGMEQSIYAMSLTSIELDQQSEAKYLHSLAQGLNISPEVCNQIHEQVGAPTIYS